MIINTTALSSMVVLMGVGTKKSRVGAKPLLIKSISSPLKEIRMEELNSL
jgi:hypothetical protein